MKCDLDTLLDIHARMLASKWAIEGGYPAFIDRRTHRLTRLFEAAKRKLKTAIVLMACELSRPFDVVVEENRPKYMKRSPESQAELKMSIRKDLLIHAREKGWLDECSCIRIVGSTEWNTNGCKIHEEGK